MLKAGWKREVCPQCRGVGRVYQRVREEYARKEKVPIEKVTFVYAGRYEFAGCVAYSDICDSCGDIYVYEVTSK